MKSETVQFKDQNPSWVYEVESAPDATFGTADSNEASLENFFSRPIKIQEYEWSTTIPTLFESFNPWQDFFENPRVLNRLSNFALMRAKLHVKFVINGNGFYYGRLIAGYTPLQNRDQFSLDRAFLIRDLVELSQKPHVYLDPATSQGGELALPFFWYKNALSIPLQEWRQMGSIDLRTLNVLQHANGAVAKSTVSVFAWATDVEVSVPTSTAPFSLGPQCGEEEYIPQSGDEYGKGPISRPASILARIAGGLSKVPVIGPYARATEMAASATSSIATTFGYSRPVVLNDINSYRPTTMGNLANTNTPDTCQKLTIDAKQELTVDPRTTGLSATDEMAIKSIATRESYLTTVAWDTTRSPEEWLFSTRVSPVNWDEENSEIHLPACCFAALPFRYWRGTIKYRFQVVASQFHKGRLKVVYEPYITASNEYNTNYTYIVDIAEEKDFTIECGWGQPTSYLQHDSPGRDPIPFQLLNAGDLPDISSDTQQCNGFLNLAIVNDLTVPNSTATNIVRINIFVSAGDDFEVACPTTDDIQDLSFFTLTPPAQLKEGRMVEEDTFAPQSGEEPLEMGDTDASQSEPVSQQVSHTFAETTSSADATNHVFFGEEIKSFRQCLKRYNYHTTACPGIGDNSRLWKVAQNAFPYHRGRAPGAIHGTYNYSKMTLLNYLTPAYVGFRGGIRWKVMTRGNNIETNSLVMARRLNVDGTNKNYSNTSVQVNTYDTPAFGAYDSVTDMPSTWEGATVNAYRANPCIEAEIPFQDFYRFHPARASNFTSNAINSAFQNHWEFLTTYDIGDDTQQPARLTTGGVVADFHVATAEDFSHFFFLGSPIVYYTPSFPAPN